MLAFGFLLTCVLQLDLSNLLYCLGALLGIISTPDWDVDNGFIGDQMIRDKLGKFAEKIWKALLYWYRRSLKHGSPLSHFPIISTYGRLAYLFIILVVIPHTVFYYLFFPQWNLMFVLNWYWSEITAQQKIIIGLIASDTIHWSLDILTTEHKTNSTKNI